MSVRVDKYLWSVRLYKTRSQATDACRSGKVTINEQEVKPSREVKEGDIISISKDSIIRTIKIIQLLKNRVGAKLVDQYMEDLTPQEEYDKLVTIKSKKFEYRQRGLGRPTKRERRDIDHLKKYLK